MRNVVSALLVRLLLRAPASLGAAAEVPRLEPVKTEPLLDNEGFLFLSWGRVAVVVGSAGDRPSTQLVSSGRLSGLVDEGS